MASASLSISKGKGSIRHNTREFKAKNVDGERSSLNVAVVNEPIKLAYNKLFGEALEKYNDKQKRNDRKIPDYYQHIRHSRQEKPFYEIIVQVGNRYNSKEINSSAEKILVEFVEKCQQKYSNVYIFGAYVHMDEDTPHLHLDYIPVAFNQKRGLETRNSHNLAMKSMGFTDYRDFRADMMDELVGICKKYGIERQVMNNYTPHYDIHTYKKIAHEADKYLEQSVSQINEKLEEHKASKIPPEQVKRKDRLEYMADLFNENMELYEKLLTQKKEIQFYKSAAEQEEKPIQLELATEKIKNLNLKKELDEVKKENSYLKASILRFKEIFRDTCQIISSIYKIPFKKLSELFDRVRDITDDDSLKDVDKQMELDYIIYQETGELPEEQELDLDDREQEMEL